LHQRGEAPQCGLRIKKPGANLMDATPSDLLMQVEGMTCDGCAAAVRRAIQRLDPDARVAVDLDHGRVAVTTTAQALSIAEALTEAGYTASAMTG
jgi:copper chaperone